MIRERIANVPEERSVTLYRFWHCIDCGLQFSMLTRELPKLCPRCCKGFNEFKDPVVWPDPPPEEAMKALENEHERNLRAVVYAQRAAKMNEGL